MDAEDEQQQLDMGFLRPGLSEEYSLWVLPGGRTAEALQAEIARLRAARPGAPHITPHTTVLPKLAGPPAVVLAKAKDLAKTLPPYYIAFDRVACGNVYYQTVYLACKKDAQTMRVGAAAREAFGVTTGPYMPHLSLLYDAGISNEEKDATVEASQQRLFGEGLLPEAGYQVDRLSVWYLPEEDTTCESWYQIAEFPLTGAMA